MRKSWKSTFFHYKTWYFNKRYMFLVCTCTVKRVLCNVTRPKQISCVFNALSSFISKISCSVSERQGNRRFFENEWFLKWNFFSRSMQLWPGCNEKSDTLPLSPTPTDSWKETVGDSFLLSPSHTSLLAAVGENWPGLNEKVKRFPFSDFNRETSKERLGESFYSLWRIHHRYAYAHAPCVQFQHSCSLRASANLALTLKSQHCASTSCGLIIYK